jgi:[ribosomal protein S18]-alanine N-acetyltransferase
VLQQVEIRRARLADVDAVVALERATEHAPHWTRATYAEIVRAGEMGDGGQADGAVQRCIFIAEQVDENTDKAERRMVGFAVGAVSESAELESVVVAAGVRRAGIGRTLCEAVIAWSRARGAEEMMLEVRAANAGGIALYAGLGFTDVARRTRYYRDPEDNAVVMRLVP